MANLEFLVEVRDQQQLPQRFLPSTILLAAECEDFVRLRGFREVEAQVVFLLEPVALDEVEFHDSGDL